MTVGTLSQARAGFNPRGIAVDNAPALPQVARMLAAESFAALAAALRERRALIADREFYRRDPAAHLAKLQSVSESIVTLQAQLPPPLDPQFAHYLERCSYDKALAFLEAQGFTR